MDREKRMRAWIRAEVMLLFIMMGAFLLRETGRTESMEQAVVTATSAAGKDYIKWVDFTVSYEALCQAYDWDVDTFDTEHHVEWIPLLAYTAARTGGEFDKKALKILNETAEKLVEGEAEIETLTKDMKYYPYYLEAVRRYRPFSCTLHLPDLSLRCRIRRSCVPTVPSECRHPRDTWA